MKITIAAATAALLMCATAVPAQTTTETPAGDAAADSASAPATEAADEEPHMTPAERDAATARGVQFKTQMTAALSQPSNPLYLAALNGSANDKWVWGLALTAGRSDTGSVPPAQLKTFNAYIKKVDKEKDKYARKHKDESLPDKALEEWVPPTPDEALAVRVVQAINTPGLWLDMARDGVDGAVFDQSLDCLTRLHDSVESDDMMSQLMRAIMGDTPGMADLMASLSGGDKDDSDLDNDAVCGGADAWAAYKPLVKTYFQPTLSISVSKGDK